MFNNLKDKKIILASQSPRRQELLKGLDIEFEIRIKEIEENYPATISPESVPEYLADLKAAAFNGAIGDNEIIITSDTIVILNDSILEKPKSEDEAKGMIRKLSGNTHTVVTGVCIKSQTRKELFSDHTKVTFCDLEEYEINYYIEKYKPFDKAGSYGVQEWIGYVAIDKLEGSYFTVMGFPLHKVYKSLKTF
jgi:septum formation protein